MNSPGAVLRYKTYTFVSKVRAKPTVCTYNHHIKTKVIFCQKKVDILKVEILISKKSFLTVQEAD